MGEVRDMREWNALRSYPQPEERVIPTRTIRERIVASYRGKDFFDGPRSCGYGGYKHDNRWAAVREDIIADYALEAWSRVIQFGSEKGYLLAELASQGIKVTGIEASSYARRHSMVKDNIKTAFPVTELTNPYDLAIAIGVVYTLNLADAMNMIRQLERIAHKAFVTLAAYDAEEDLKLFRKWTLLGTTILRKDDWREVLNHCGYTGDYWFVTAETLNLKDTLRLKDSS